MMEANVKEEAGEEEGRAGAACEQWRLAQKEVDPTWVEHGRRWKRSELFLAKLACLGWDGELLPFHNCLRRAAWISQVFQITGFHDGGEEQPSMIQVNDGWALSLAPDVVGRVLGISYAGSSVPARGYASLYESVKDHLQQPRGKDHACRNGVFLKDMYPRLQHYVLAHIDRLFLSRHPAVVTVGQACAFIGASFHGEVYNWAQHRVDYVRRRLRTTRDKPLPKAAKELLLAYVSAALPSLPKARVHRNVGLGGEGGNPISDGVRKKRTRNLNEFPTRWSRRLCHLASQASTGFDVKSKISRQCRGQAPGKASAKRKTREGGSTSSEGEEDKELKKARAELEEMRRDLETVKLELQAKEEEVRAMQKEHDGTIAAMGAIIDGYAVLWSRHVAGK